MTVADICHMNDLSVQRAEMAVEAMQEKELITGFVPGDLHAEINSTAKAAI